MLRRPVRRGSEAGRSFGTIVKVPSLESPSQRAGGRDRENRISISTPEVTRANADRVVTDVSRNPVSVGCDLKSVVSFATVAERLPEGFCASEQVVDYGTGSVAVAEAPTDAARLERLMLGYQRADAQAVTELVARLSPMLLRFMAGPVQTRPYAEDMLQDCWLRIHKARHTYRPGTPVLPWVFAIARYTRVDAYRRRRRIDDRETALDERGQQEGAEPTSRGSDAGLWKLVGQLPARQQEVIRMLKILGMSLEEVASATGASVGSVKQRAHRAYEKLRMLLQQQAQGEGDGR